MNAYRIYQGSNGAQTRKLYRELEKAGPVGVVAASLFRAQKYSRRAKRYGPYAGVGDRSYRDLAYEQKGVSIARLCEVLTLHAESLGIKFGWGIDERQPRNIHVLYIDLDLGQVSFHSIERYSGPDYAGEWDGRRASEERIIRFCQRVIDACGERSYGREKEKESGQARTN